MALFIVSTPIGNLKDITLNALEILHNAHLILAENTLVTSNLLSKHNILNKKILNFTDHTKEQEIIEFLTQAKEKNICLVSDAGTPIISDPGYLLIKKAHEMQITIHSIPGASSLTSAISVCGLPSYNFAFLGFFEENKVQKSLLLLQNDITVAFFIPARDLKKTFIKLEHDFLHHTICVARELTKIFEDIKMGSIKDLQNHYTREEKNKGEAVLIISPLKNKINKNLEDLLDKILTNKPFLKKLPKKDLAEVLKAYEEELSNFSKKEIYNIIVKKT